MIQMYHNPRCGKSRNCLAFLIENKIDVQIIKYLETPPSKEEIKIVLQKLNRNPLQLIRTKERIWLENYAHLQLTDEDLIQAMVAHPILIERPILMEGNSAIIGRVLEELNPFLRKKL